MKRKLKDIVQYGSAILMLISAIVLAFWSFYRLSEIHNTVLAYVGEAIAFAAAVYGLALFARHEISKEMQKWFIENNELKRSDDDILHNE